MAEVSMLGVTLELAAIVFVLIAINTELRGIRRALEAHRREDR